MQEFRVESNNYPAEFGTGTGGQVSVVTKSGANKFRGSLFEYYRNDEFDAPNYFDSTRNTDGSVIQELPKSKLSQHQFGGSFGGPMLRDRAFFFGSYEGYRLDAGVNFVEAAPSAAAWARAVPAIAALRPGFTVAERRAAARERRRTPTSTSTSCRASRTSRRTRSARASTSGSRSNGRRTSACSTTTARRCVRRASAAASSAVTNNPTNAIFNLQGTFGAASLNEFKVGYNAPARASSATRRWSTASTSATMAFNLSGSIANTGIAGQSGLVRHRRAGRPGARQQRHQRPRPAVYDP